MALSLESIRTTGSEALPPRIVIHGPHGIGKSTFAANGVAPIFVPTEDGLSAIKAAAFPLCKAFPEVIEALRALAVEDHDYRTVVIDSADWLEAMIWNETAKAHGHSGIEDFGYGKGDVMALDYWRKLITALDHLRREKKMASIVICHTEIRRFDSPETDPYDRYQLKLHKGASALLQEWADIVGFANQRVVIRETDAGFNKKVKRGMSTGERMLYYQEKAAFQAKTRYRLPESTPLTWSAFSEAYRAANLPVGDGAKPTIELPTTHLNPEQEQPEHEQ